MKKQNRALHLRKETLRVLTNLEIASVQGGDKQSHTGDCETLSVCPTNDHCGSGGSIFTDVACTLTTF